MKQAATSKEMPVRDTAPDEEKIRVRAYQFYEERGREDGHDLDDWLKAEAEIISTTRAMAA